MANFVLVHGAYHWGGCFQKVAQALQEAGHNVATPDLTSHGLDATPPEQVKDMAHYTRPVRRILEAAAEPVILLGHSMGGLTCTYLGEALPEKIAALVYLTAVMLPSGTDSYKYMNTEIGLGSPKAEELRQIMVPAPTGSKLDLSRPDLLRAAFYHDCSDHDFAVAAKNVQPVQSPAPLRVPNETTPERFGRKRRVYIECTLDKTLPIEIQRQMQADSPGAEVFTLETAHSPFFSAPEALARILCRLV